VGDFWEFPKTGFSGTTSDESIYIYVYVRIFICTCICIQKIYIYMCICMYIYIYVYMVDFLRRQAQNTAAALHHTAEHWTTVRHTATHWRAYWPLRMSTERIFYGSKLRMPSLHCNTLQHNAAPCDALQRVLTFENV